MSPLFGRKAGEHKDDSVVAPLATGGYSGEIKDAAVSALDAEVARLSALSLEALATEVMTKVMVFTARSDSGPMELFNVARVLMPPELRDEAESDLRLRDLVGEAVQVLEQSRLVRLEAWSQSQYYHVGYIITRLGSAAVQQDVVERTLGGSSL